MLDKKLVKCFEKAFCLWEPFGDENEMSFNKNITKLSKIIYDRVFLNALPQVFETLDFDLVIIETLNDNDYFLEFYSFDKTVLTKIHYNPFSKIWYYDHFDENNQRNKCFEKYVIYSAFSSIGQKAKDMSASQQILFQMILLSLLEEWKGLI